MNLRETLHRAVLLHQSGKLSEAEMLYRQILQNEPNDSDALHMLGMIESQRGRHDVAEELVARSIALRPETAGFHNDLGNVLQVQKKYAEAVDCYQKAIALDPNYHEAHNNLGVSLLAMGKRDEAIVSYRKAIALCPQYPSPYNNLGNALRSERKLSAAVSEYRKAIERKRDYHEAWSNLGIALLAMGELAECISACRNAIALRADGADAHYTFAMALESAGQREEAVTELKEAVRLRPDATKWQFDLAAAIGDASFTAAPREFVVGLFNNYAAYFDQHLVEVLKYRAPQLLFDAIRAIGPAGPMDIADLGCGTGLCGPLFKPLTRSLIGVDLAPKMIAKSRERGVYDDLVVDELTTFLSTRQAQFDLALAADVFNYFGDLAPVFAATASALRANGLFAFTVEEHEGNGFALLPTRRFAHSLKYVREIAAANGFTEVSATLEVLRMQSGKEARGWVIVLSRS